MGYIVGRSSNRRHSNGCVARYGGVSDQYALHCQQHATAHGCLQARRLMSERSLCRDPPQQLHDVC